MRLNRFIGNFDLSGKTVTIKDREFFNQIKNVLRLGKDDNVILANGDVNEAIATVERFEGDDTVILSVSELFKNDIETKREVVLYCSVLKKENFEFVAQKATETGVAKIVPIIAERTVKLGLNLERLRKIVKEAAEQSGRRTVPEILEIIDLDQAFDMAKDSDYKIFFDISGPDVGVITSSKTSIFIGPEGGWTESELNSARENKFVINNIGKLVLRAETAAIIGSFMAVNM